MLKEQSANYPPQSRVEQMSDGIAARIVLVDPATITETQNDDNNTTTYEYEYYMIYRPWSDDLPDNVSSNFDAWLDMVKTEDAKEAADGVRSLRDKLLSASDYLVAIDYPMPDDNRAQIIAYRQALRDVTKQDGFPYDIYLPDEPEILRGGDTVYGIIHAMTGEA